MAQCFNVLTRKTIVKLFCGKDTSKTVNIISVKKPSETFLQSDNCIARKENPIKGKGINGFTVIGHLIIWPMLNFCGFKREFHWMFCKNSPKRDEQILMKWKTGSPIDVNFIRQMLCVFVEAETVQAKDLFYLILIGNSSRVAPAWPVGSLALFLYANVKSGKNRQWQFRKVPRRSAKHFGTL